MSEKNLVTSVIFNKKFYGHYRVLCFSEPVGQKGSNIVPVTTRKVYGQACNTETKFYGQACNTERFMQVTDHMRTNAEN